MQLCIYEYMLISIYVDNCIHYIIKVYFYRNLVLMERQKRQQPQLMRQKNLPEKVDKREKWNPLYIRIAFNFALLGYAEREMAEVIGVSAQTITKWKATYPDFKRNWDKGKAEADGEVAREWYKNCFDRTYIEEEAKIVNGKIEKIKVEKFIKGDSKLIMRWLSTRQRDHWSMGDKVKTTNNVFNFTDLRKYNISFEEMKLLERIAYKPLTEGESGNI